jgi:signal transduction histidine kinase
MNKVASIRKRSSEGPDFLIAAAAFEACPEGLAVLEDMRVVEANAAFRRMLGPDVHIEGETLSQLGIDDHSLPMGISSGRFSSCGRNLRVITLTDAQPSADSLRAPKLEAVGRLVSGVAHDFNNLLTGIILCCDLLLMKLESASPLRRYVDEMKTAVAQGSTLIHQLLTVLREEPVTQNPLSWNRIVGEMRSLLSRLIGENIELATELADDIPPVPLPAAEARQIVLNLVLNARDAMPDGGRIVLSTRDRWTKHEADLRTPSAHWVEFEVSDNGCGMDEKVRQTIFQPFFTTKSTGNGLGLATVKTIIDKRGGSIEVASAPGRGTQITIGFPAAYTEAASTQRPKGSSAYDHCFRTRSEPARGGGKSS